MEYEEDVAPVMEEAADLSQRLGGGVWTDDLPAYQSTDCVAVNVFRYTTEERTSENKLVTSPG